MNCNLKYLFKQTELQSICRALRLLQTHIVSVIALYVMGTVDDTHWLKHSTKAGVSKDACGDYAVDPLYSTPPPKSAKSFFVNSETLNRHAKLQKVFSKQVAFGHEGGYYG